MRKTTNALTTLVVAGTLTALGLALAPTAMAATPSQSAAANSSSSSSSTGEQRGRDGHGPRGDRPGLETVMNVLDLTVDELKAARHAGTTLAELAEQQGVDVDALIRALVADAEEHITERVASGDLTQEKADERLAKIEQRITDRVNGVAPDRGQRGPGRAAHDGS